MIKNNSAYILNDGVYFDTSKDKDYLSLSHKNDSEDNIARVSSNENKKNEKDFCSMEILMKKMVFKSFGKGRPMAYRVCCNDKKTPCL